MTPQEVSGRGVFVATAVVTGIATLVLLTAAGLLLNRRPGGVAGAAAGFALLAGCQAVAAAMMVGPLGVGSLTPSVVGVVVDGLRAGLLLAPTTLLLLRAHHYGPVPGDDDVRRGFAVGAPGGRVSV